MKSTCTTCACLAFAGGLLLLTIPSLWGFAFFVLGAIVDHLSTRASSSAETL